MNKSGTLIEPAELLQQCHETANVTQKYHGLGFDVRFHLLQPGDKQLVHGPRIKVFQKSNLSSGFLILLNKDENKIAVSDDNKNKTIDTVNSRQLKTILRHIKKYRNAYLKMWNNTDMTLEELKDAFRGIDKGEIE